MKIKLNQYISMGLFILFLCSYSYAEDTILLNDIDLMNLDEVTINQSQQTAQFEIFETITGITTTYNWDLQAGTWSSADSLGNWDSGTLPPDSTQWSIPCFTSPFAVGVCVGATVGASWFCEARDRRFLRRSIQTCGVRGIASFNAGICGFNASFTCGEMALDQMP